MAFIKSAVLVISILSAFFIISFTLSPALAASESGEISAITGSVQLKTPILPAPVDFSSCGVSKK